MQQCGGQRSTFGSQFSPYIVSLKFRLSDLVASAFHLLSHLTGPKVIFIYFFCSNSKLFPKEHKLDFKKQLTIKSMYHVCLKSMI